MTPLSPAYRPNDIERAFAQSGIGVGDVVFTHANVAFFGRLEGAETDWDYYDAFQHAFESVAGAEGTWVLPTFSYSFCWGTPFDPSATPGVCGTLSECMRHDLRSIRSHDGNFSVVAVGGQAHELTRAGSENVYGQDGFFARLLKMGGKISNFNLDASSTFLHFVERELGVRYRWDKQFDGTLLVGGRDRGASSWHYVRDLDDVGTKPSVLRFNTLARRLGLAKVASLGRGQIVTIPTVDVLRLCQTMVNRDPEFLVSRGAARIEDDEAITMADILPGRA